MTREAILKEAMLLPPEERVRLADELWHGLDTELTAAQAADLRDRIAEDDAGLSNPISVEEFKAQMRRNPR